jgi:alcohol dehydrogenase (cytochrome c)/quinohemoprotein ethanol dehydrogenase
MSFNPGTGLVYIPVQDGAFPYVADAAFAKSKLAYNSGFDFNAASMPQIPAVKEQILASSRFFLLAWDPVRQAETWRVEYPGPSNGGTLTTAGNLVVQGTAGGDLVIYRADDGAKLWSAHVQTGVLAGPVSYAVDGDQYIAVPAGWGGVFALAPGEIGLMSGRLGNKSRVLSFKLGGQAELPDAAVPAPLAFDPPPQTADEKTVSTGKALYHRHCVTCHGDAAVSAGLLPDLRASPALDDESWQAIVTGGQLTDRGMVSFASELDAADVEAIRAYVIARAHESIALAEGE